MNKQFNEFSTKNLDFKERWESFSLEGSQPIHKSEHIDCLTPFSGTSVYSKLSKDTKFKLYEDFIHFIIEIIIYLENLYSTTFYKHVQNLKNKNAIDEQEFNTIKKFVDEEAYHKEHFLKFIQFEKKHGRTEDFLFLNNNLVIKGLTFAVDHSPFSFLIAAAKSEVFSVEYAKYIKNVFGSWDANSLTKIHHYHLLDEAHHVNFQVDLYNLGYQRNNLIEKVKFIPFGLIFIICMQFVMIKTSMHFIRRIYQGNNPLVMMKLMFSFGNWVLNEFTPYLTAKNKTAQLIRQKRPIFQQFYKLIYR